MLICNKVEHHLISCRNFTKDLEKIRRSRYFSLTECEIQFGIPSNNDNIIKIVNSEKEKYIGKCTIIVCKL